RKARAHRRHDRRDEHHRPEHDIGREPEEGGSARGHHRVLVQELADAAVREPDARRLAGLQPGAALIDPAEKERRRGEGGDDLEHLRDDLDRRHSTSASSTTRVTKPYSRYVAMRPCCSQAKESATLCTSAPSGSYKACQIRSPTAMW